jgi:3'-phosphoadenosine 5'-phosphosulfate sulfotransferase (PAPS reductase)/FAD synthetase
MGDQTPSATALVTHIPRERILARKIRQSEEIIRQGIVDHVLKDGRRVAAMGILISGGNDSTLMGHLLKGVADVAIHCNTGTGIPQTLDFVRATCASWDLPLLEFSPPVSYEDLVLDQGFPGPAQHYKMFQRLKHRGIREARRKYVKNPYKERMVFFAGRRNAESWRREKLPVQGDREGSQVYISPIIHWDAMDMNTYRVMYDVPRNPVSDILHMSGECLCGSFAAVDERESLREWYPEVDARISALEARVRAVGDIKEKYCTWGWGAFEGKGSASKKSKKVGIMCTDCEGKGEGGAVVALEHARPFNRNAPLPPPIARPVDLLDVPARRMPRKKKVEALAG